MSFDTSNVKYKTFCCVRNSVTGQAVHFYQTILEIEIDSIELGGLKQGLLPHDDKSLVSGAIVCGMDYKPSRDGSLNYLNGGDDLEKVLGKVEAAGGEILFPKTYLGDCIGYIAHFVDSEGIELVFIH